MFRRAYTRLHPRACMPPTLQEKIENYLLPPFHNCCCDFSSNFINSTTRVMEHREGNSINTLHNHKHNWHFEGEMSF
jgi:hypothetical protein